MHSNFSAARSGALTTPSANRVLLTWDRNLSIRYEADKQRQHLER